MKDNNTTILTSASFGLHALDAILSIIDAVGNALEERVRRILSLVTSTLHFISSCVQLALDFIQNNLSNIILSAIKLTVSFAKLTHAFCSVIMDRNATNNAFQIGSNILNGIHTMFTVAHVTTRAIQFAHLNKDEGSPKNNGPQI